MHSSSEHDEHNSVAPAVMMAMARARAMVMNRWCDGHGSYGFCIMMVTPVHESKPLLTTLPSAGPFLSGMCSPPETQTFPLNLNPEAPNLQAVEPHLGVSDNNSGP